MNRAPVHPQQMQTALLQRPYPRATSTSPTLASSSRPPDNRVAVSRRASLSLAAITTPYRPETTPFIQSKKLQAQTLLSLGLRLRQRSAITGPAKHTAHRQVPIIRSRVASRVHRTRNPQQLRCYRKASNRSIRRCYLICPLVVIPCHQVHISLDITTSGQRHSTRGTQTTLRP